MKRLTIHQVKTIKRRGLYRAAPTLYLRVSQTGGKSWIQRVLIANKRTDLGLGGFPEVTLNEARDKAYENRRLLRSGVSPMAAAMKAKAPTFRKAAEATYNALLPNWKNTRTASNWIGGLDRHAMNYLGDVPVDMIERTHVLHVLNPIWTTSPEAAKRVRRAVRQTLQWAIGAGYMDQNMAGSIIDGALPKQKPNGRHYKALPYREVAGALTAIMDSKASMSARLAFRFLVLTAVRTVEVRGATWGEIDMDAATWEIPADRMKQSEPHRVPLSPAALDVLRQAKALDKGQGWIFPSPHKNGGTLSDMTLRNMLKKTVFGPRADVHGFRSSFADFAAEETNARHAVREKCLAHAVGSQVERAYSRSDLFDLRRNLMNQWSEFING